MFSPVMLLNCPAYSRYDLKSFSKLYRAMINPLKSKVFHLIF